MTRLAPPTLYQCPACAGYFKHYALRSLFFDDAVPQWSDGKNGNWWARESGSVGRCPSCTSVVWIEDAEPVMLAPSEPLPIGPLARAWHRMTGDKRGRLREEREWHALPKGLQHAQRIGGLHHAHDLIEAIQALPRDAHDREIHLRRRLWWSSNDHLRGQHGCADSAMPGVAEEVAHANVRRLLELFEHDPDEQVARGELLRQLGRSDEAVAVLKAVKPDGFSEVTAAKIEGLASAGVAGLRMLNAHTTVSVSDAEADVVRKARASVW